MLRLYKFAYQPNFYEDQVNIAKSYNIEDHVDYYTNKAAVKEFLHLWKLGFLPKNRIFSPFYKSHAKNAKALFNLFYYAKDWDTFYKTACWAREYINEMMFGYTLQIAILHRNDTQGMILPPFYEIYPYFFVNSEVIDKAFEYKMKYGGTKTNEIKTFIIPANYSGWYLNTNPEQRDMAYFLEDIALNSYYACYHADYPFWMGGEEFGLDKDRRGELFYFIHQQLIAKYYLERLSNGYGSIPVFDWKEPIKTGFVPYLRHHTGMEYSTRPAQASLMYNPHNQPWSTSGKDNIFDIEKIEDYERRIRDAIDSGYINSEDGNKINIYDEDGFELLGKIIEASPDSPNTRFYGHLKILAHKILGYAGYCMDQYKVVPSALEYFITSLRDPIFYQFYKKIIYFFLKYKDHLSSYNYNDLICPGIKIQSITVDKLVTFFDYFDFEITNGLYFTEEEFQNDNIHILARTCRLNHKPFTYRINVNCDKSSDVIVRIFFGPKKNEHGQHIPINENRVNFVEMDKFIHTLQTGKNIIERHCDQADAIKDRTSYRKLYHRVLSALRGEEEFRLSVSESHNGFPTRFMLPKGKVEGQEFQFYVFISPYKPKATKMIYDQVLSTGVGSGHRYIDDLPFGYPFDRPIKDEKLFFVPNSYMKNVIVYHKTEEDILNTHM